MELIIDFYKSLDTLNLIIFWGIIIVIILLLIFSSIMINKNKKLKKLIESKNIENKYEEELPIKKESEEVVQLFENDRKKDIPDILSEDAPLQDEINQPENLTSNAIEEENTFVAEELVKSYSKEVSKSIETKQLHNDKSQTLEMPSKPYQRNVLREMSLSQTSPIGINRQVRTEEKKTEMIKDLESSLNNDHIDEKKYKVDEQIKKELNHIDKSSERKTEVQNNYSFKDNIENNQLKKYSDNYQKTSEVSIDSNMSKTVPISLELLNDNDQKTETSKEKSSSEKYLEEVSKKLSEAELPDEIERTNYELQQEEDAIISYKELMEKKDSIQTIDEEEAVISIEELMYRNNANHKSENIKQTDSKLYNLTESEENDNFIKELKQFRNDL